MALARSVLVHAAVLGLLCGCRTPHDVAMTSYQGVTAPANVVTQEPAQTTVTTTTTTTTGNQPAPRIEHRTEHNVAATEPTTAPRPRSTPSGPQLGANTAGSTRAVSSPRPKSSQLEFPTAKPVEGKPGYVYSPYEPGKYVDVSGYAPGSKVKDPYSGKIFLVP